MPAIIKQLILPYVMFPLVSYLLGSISFGLIVGKLKGVDIRAHGSGNVGATNVWRLLGKGPAIAVFALDVLKGALPALVFALVAQRISGLPSWKMLGVVYGACAIFGHVYPVFFGFRGGKAVATSCGVFMCIAPLQTFTALMIWLLVLLFLKYVSVASMAGAASFLLMVLALYPPEPINEARTFASVLRRLYPIQHTMAPGEEKHLGRPEKNLMLLFSALAVGVVFYRHRGNIKRLIDGTEQKMITSKQDLRALEAERKYGKERLAKAGRTRRPQSAEALRRISKSKPDEATEPSAEQAAAADAEQVHTTAEADAPKDASACDDTAAPEGIDSAASVAHQILPEDQLETQAPVEEVEELTAENAEASPGEAKRDTEETREISNNPPAEHAESQKPQSDKHKHKKHKRRHKKHR